MFYVSLMVTTKQKSIVAQSKRKGFQLFTVEYDVTCGFVIHGLFTLR